MWDLGMGVIIGIYLGTYYDFRPVLESIIKWGADCLPPERPATALEKVTPATHRFAEPRRGSLFAYFLTPDKPRKD